ncbi:RNA polymerase sigma factor [Jatrophihabitans telluris]|uniref:RNA polymerase sigma factor n=1 Tax=Jatrophihabitans telluris TaxID=2038343 RepID=UPI0032218FB9
MLAAIAAYTGDLELAEECTQDAFVRALDTWPRDGIPDRPGAWLTTTARRRALDDLRRRASLRQKLPLLTESEARVDDGVPGAADSDATIPDDRLRLIFTCCHPALAREAQVALTLRMLCGLTTAEIARAFLVSEPTMAARVTRAKKKISAARIPYRVPAASELPDRLDAVLTVLHLVFTTGHTASVGDRLHRPELTDRSVSLARMVVRLMPDEAEAKGLLALMLVDEARAPARTDAAGELVLIADQDRRRWNRALIEEGRALLVVALRTGGRPGRFALQAAIAALHAEAPRAEDTDWRQIVGLYDLLLVVWPSPVVALNRAVAVSMMDGAAAGLAALASLSPAEQGVLARYHYYPAVKADLFRQLGRSAEAAEQYRLALELVDNAAERRFLARRLSELAPTR